MGLSEPNACLDERLAPLPDEAESALQWKRHGGTAGSRARAELKDDEGLLTCFEWAEPKWSYLWWHFAAKNRSGW